MNILKGPQIVPDVRAKPSLVVGNHEAAFAAYGPDIYAELVAEAALAADVINVQQEEKHTGSNPIIIDAMRLNRPDLHAAATKQPHRQAVLVVADVLEQRQPGQAHIAAAALLRGMDITPPFHPAMRSWLTAITFGRKPDVQSSLL